MRGIDGAKTRRKRADTLLAIHLQVEDVNNEGIAGLCTFYIKRTRKRIVAFNEGHAVAGFLQRVAEAVERIGLENVPGLKVCPGGATPKTYFTLSIVAWY